ncbi:hypothetical protein BGX28_005602 [Mortierella sp. GBA30]|nr:hypothetical protein BGX28_005602 [Mortierella sp. GBA30]
MVVTNGRSLHLSTVDLRLHFGQCFVTELVNIPDDGRVYRHHVLAPDRYRLLPGISTAIPDDDARSRLLPDTTKVDIGAIDLGKEFMAAFACRRYDKPDFIYTVHIKNKAAHQPTVLAEKELEGRKDSTTIIHSDHNPPYEEAIAVYESRLSSLDADPKYRREQEQTDEYRQYSGFYNNQGQQQKRQSQAKRARRGEFDVLTSRILTAMGTHRS